VYTLHSSMALLVFLTDPSFECTDDDSVDIAFVHATSLIGSRGAVE
jgi:hypothetical protein